MSDGTVRGLTVDTASTVVALTSGASLALKLIACGATEEAFGSELDWAPPVASAPLSALNLPAVLGVATPTALLAKPVLPSSSVFG